MLPYRKITTAELEQCLDDPGSLARTAPPSRRRILRDAVRSFHRHLPQLRVRLGALLGIRSVESPLDQAWRNLKQLGRNHYFDATSDSGLSSNQPRSFEGEHVTQVMWLAVLYYR